MLVVLKATNSVGHSLPENLAASCLIPTNSLMAGVTHTYCARAYYIGSLRPVLAAHAFISDTSYIYLI